MSYRRLAVPVAIILLILMGLFLVARRPQANTSSVSTGNTPFTYTNAITGQTVEDKPAEFGQQVPVPYTHVPAATIFGIEQTHTFFTDAQFASLQALLGNFLLAHSGLADVSAGILNQAVTSPDSQTIQFTLVVVRPQVTYRVTAYVANQFQAVPDVTFKQVSEAGQ